MNYIWLSFVPIYIRNSPETVDESVVAQHNNTWVLLTF